jgi:3-methyladenine DNA glycosylase AlkD
MRSGPSARSFVERLRAMAPASGGGKGKARARGQGRADEDVAALGVRMGQVFDLAKEFIDMTPEQIEKLLESPIREAKVGALSIMDKQARRAATPETRRKELFDLYLRRIDLINHWDLVDLGAPHVVGRYLFDKPRRILFRLARSRDPWARRTAIVSSLYFVRKGDVADTFKLAELLLDDEHEAVRKATGGLLREAGKKDAKQLLRFLDHYAPGMARVTLTYAMEHLTKTQREQYRRMRA